MFKQLCIIGVGLIGGSIAKAAKQRGLTERVVGFGRPEGEANLKTAQELGIIDRYSFDIADALADSDCVVVCTPVGSFQKIFSLIKPHWREDVIYTDAGSTKGSVVAAVESVFGHVPANFVPAHPIAGAEKSGAAAALADLYVNKRLIITPLPDTNPQALAKLQAFWQALGSEVVLMDVDHHDAVLAATSHLPHILAFALVGMLGRKDEQREIFKFAAGGFKDFSRIASSDPTMWLDISLANKDKILPLIAQLKDELSSIETLIQADDANALYEQFSYAKQARQRFLDVFENGKT